MSEFFCETCNSERTPIISEGEDVCIICKRKEIYNDIHPKIVNFSRFHILRVIVSEYSEPIINDDYLLIRIGSEISSAVDELLNCIEIEPEVKQYIQKEGEYIFSSKKPIASRTENYLYNCYAKSSSYSHRIMLVSLMVESETKIIRKKELIEPRNNLNKLEIPKQGLTEMFNVSELESSSPRIEDIDIQLILKKLYEMKSSSYLFRGIKQYHPDNDGISSSIYRENEKLANEGMLQEHEKFSSTKLLNEPYYKPNKLVSALTDLRHSGKDTCLLDFSMNPKIALFFACQVTDSPSSGEILAFSLKNFKQIPREEDIEYPVTEDCVLYPSSVDNETSQRVIAQQSVFVYCQYGYLPRDEYSNTFENIMIAPRLKRLLRNYCGFTEESIYPDFQGFMDNSNNFFSPASLYVNAKELMNEADRSKVQFLKERKYNRALIMLRNCLKDADRIWDKYPEILIKVDECKEKIEKINENQEDINIESD